MGRSQRVIGGRPVGALAVRGKLGSEHRMDPQKKNRKKGDGGKGGSPVLEAVQLPARVTDLATGLADVDGDTFAHDEEGLVCLTLS